ncbi:MAG: NifB/NifX family molybdenum-iron cluster-binding protein [Planctomycetes bacterium]|nr:NifB/NifX family molybdenum-iron cluster-binding protein [Planctomycetota bacterium]
MTVVAFGTNDGKELCTTHFGMSARYIVCEIDDGRVARRREVLNPYADPDKHKHAETDDIMSVLEGVDVCIGRKMGRKSPPIIHSYGRVPLLTDAERIEDALDAFLKADAGRFRQYSVERSQWLPAEDSTLRALVFGTGRKEKVP